MPQKRINIDVALSDAVERDGPMTLCAVLIHLHDIAEEFGIQRATKMIRTVLPEHAARDPSAALAFALRSSPADGRLAYQALSNFNLDTAKACDIDYWIAIGQKRMEFEFESPYEGRDKALSWAIKSLKAFARILKEMDVEGHKPTYAGCWEQVASRFLKAIGVTWPGSSSKQRKQRVAA
jgi:hypothetical protein